MARTKIKNFATENVKESRNGVRKVDAAEGVRDVFGRILAVAALSSASDVFDLRHLLSYPITTVPLSLAHSDGTPLKTDKATLTKALESRQDVVFVDANLPPIKATIIDDGILLHESVMQHSKSTYATMARDMLVKVCCHRGDQIHLLLDKCKSPSIKDVERKLRGHGNENAFTITGPDQAQRQSGTELLNNGAFKEGFASFLMIEWRMDHYGPVVGNKTVYISHGGKCMMMQNNNDHDLVITEQVNLQSQHEEADTLVAFHAKQAPEGNILVRSTDTDVLVILLGLAGRSRRSNIILDYGSGNHRRYIGVSNIAAILNEKQAGMTEALLGMHALTGCDFTSCFFRKGKLKPFQRLVTDTSERHVSALQSLTSDNVDMPGVKSFVCSMYGFPTSDINEARYKAFIRMSGGDEKDPLATIKKINCASLPPCNKTLGNHVKRAQFVSMMWKRADQTDPTGEAIPTDYGWKEINNRLEPDWFPGRSVPETLGATRRDEATTRMDDAASHIGDVATDEDVGTNRTDDPHDDVDDMDMVDTTSTDDEFESAWREDSDDSAEEDQ